MAEVYSGTATRAWQVCVGCDPHMPCAPRCWAREADARTVRCLRQDHPERAAFFAQALTPDLQQWNGKVFLDEAHLTDPLRHRKPEAYATAYHGDWARLADADKDRMFAVMLACHCLDNSVGHEFRLLSKQPAMVRGYLVDHGGAERLMAWAYAGDGLVHINGGDTWFHEAIMGATCHDWDAEGRNSSRSEYRPWGYISKLLPIPNVRLGFSLMTQLDADAALPHARALHDANWKIWVSMEPQIGPIDLRGWEFLTWIVQGCESGPRARYFSEEWARTVRDFCHLCNSIPYFLKQGPSCAGIIEHPFLDGRRWTEQPK